MQRDTALIEKNELLQNGLQPHSQVTLLFSMSEVSLASLQH